MTTTDHESDAVAERIAELKAIDGLQGRIDRVAEDLTAGTNRYAVIDAWTLGELLGVYFDDSGGGDWHQMFYTYEVKPEDGSDSFPFADNVDLLDGEVSTKRFEALAKRAATIIARGDGVDLKLSDKEEQILREAYQREHGGAGCLTVASIDVTSTAGVDLTFEGTLSDGYPDGGAWSPYDLAEGGGFDSSGFVLQDS